MREITFITTSIYSRSREDEGISCSSWNAFERSNSGQTNWEMIDSREFGLGRSKCDLVKMKKIVPFPDKFQAEFLAVVPPNKSLRSILQHLTQFKLIITIAPLVQLQTLYEISARERSIKERHFVSMVQFPFLQNRSCSIRTGKVVMDCENTVVSY